MSNLSKIVVGGTTYDIAGKSLTEGYYYNNKFYKEAAHTTEITGETQKIYVDLATEKIYRWSGSAFVEISAGSAGTTYILSGETTSNSQQSVKLTPSVGEAQTVPVVGKRINTLGLIGEIFNSYSGSYVNTASGAYSHAEGYDTTASGNYSHAEGNSTNASGNDSHAEGYNTTASGDYSHAEGRSTTASGTFAHTQNEGTKASSANQTALGKYNIEDSSGTYAVIVGNGTTDNSRSNALTIDWYGNIYCNNSDTSINTAITDIVDVGSKNLMNLYFFKAISSHNITISYSGWGTYSLSGTADTTSAVDYLRTDTAIFNNLYGLEAGETYIISSGIDSNKSLMRVDCSTNGTSFDINLVNNIAGQAEFTIPSNATGILIRFRCTSNAGSLDNTTLKPMICKKSLYNISTKFDGYAVSNSLITSEIRDLIDSGEKNHFNFKKQAINSNAIVSFPDDASITVQSNGTYARTAIPVSLTAGDYMFRCNVSELEGSNVQIRFSLNSDSSDPVAFRQDITSTGDYGRSIYLDEDTTFYVILYTNPSSTSATNKATFKNLMICTRAAWRISSKYVPYCPTMIELYQMILNQNS